MMVLRHAVTHEHQIVASLDGIDTTIWELTGDDVPGDLERCAYVFGDGGAAKVARVLSPADVVALYTSTERARIFTSAEPNVRALLTALQFSPGITVGSTEHQQGTALVAGLGLLDSPERAARILAGEKPA